MTNARLALVDDDPAFSTYLSMRLRARGYAVATYASGAELIDALGQTRPDVVLLDVLMPGMDGLETLRAIRQVHPTLQVVMLSGMQVPSTIVGAVRLGATDYVVKPDDPDGFGEAALEAAIHNAVEKAQLASELTPLRLQTADDLDTAQCCWGSGTAMRHVVAMVERVADSDIGVLISGESGVGKEVVARELHRRSARRARPFVKVNCAALPGELLESELFGHERGAFTGAQSTRIGKFEFAAGGTILLDEIGEMALSLQAKLLHVLQDHEVTRLGSNRAVAVDVRVIAATNRSLDRMIHDGQFREDLYYRLQVIEIRVPPLRERADEILPLVEFFLRRYAARYGRTPTRPSPALRHALLTYAWPGNVRELENVIKRFVILQDEALLLDEITHPRHGIETAPVVPPEPASVPAFAAPADRTVEIVEDFAALMAGTDAARPMTLPDLARRAAMSAERDAIQQTLDRLRWNRRKAARQLGVSYKTLLNKMKECGIGAPVEVSADS